MTNTQQEKGRNDGLCLPEGITTLLERKYYFSLPHTCFIHFKGLLQAYLMQAGIIVHKVTFRHMFDYSCVLNLTQSVHMLL